MTNNGSHHSNQLDTVLTSPVIAITSISTLAFIGSFATCTHERAGKPFVKTENNKRKQQINLKIRIKTLINLSNFVPFLYSSLILAKSPRFSTNIFDLTTLSTLDPAAFKIAFIFSKAFAISMAAPPGTNACVSLSRPKQPDT